MRHKIIYTDDYALIVSDEEIKKGDYIFCIEDVKDDLKIERVSIRTIHWLVNSSIFKKVIGHRPLTDAPVLEGVPLLPEFGKKEDAEKIAYNWFVTADKKNTIFDLGWVNIFTAGYNKAKETYKYTEEDLIKAIELAQTPLDYDSLPFIDEVMQSLQQQKRPKYFGCEMEPKYKHIGAVKGIYGSGFRKQNLMYGLSKTITNSQGQKELVGTYEGGDQC